MFWTEVALTSCESKKPKCGLMWGPCETLTFGHIPLSPKQLQQTHLKTTAEKNQPLSSWHKLSLKVLLSQRLINESRQMECRAGECCLVKSRLTGWGFIQGHTPVSISALLFCLPWHNISALMFSLLCPGMYFAVSVLIISLKDMQNLWCVSTTPIQLSPKITYRLQMRRLQWGN